MTDEERLRADTLDELLGKEMLDNIALRAEVERRKGETEFWAEIAGKAIAEATTLRAENKLLKDCAAVERKTIETKDRNLDHLRAENERLREALALAREFMSDDAQQGFDIARAALQSKGE